MEMKRPVQSSEKRHSLAELPLKPGHIRPSRLGPTTDQHGADHPPCSAPEPAGANLTQQDYKDISTHARSLNTHSNKHKVLVAHLVNSLKWEGTSPVPVRMRRPEVNLHNGADPAAITLPHAPEARLTSNVPQLRRGMLEHGRKR